MKKLSEQLSRFNNGDINAMGVIFDDVANRVFEYGHTETQNYFLAEELVELTMIEISKQAYKYRGNVDAEKWILNCAKKCLKDIKLRGARVDCNIYKEQEKITEDEVYLLYNSEGYVTEHKKEDILKKCHPPQKDRHKKYKNIIKTRKIALSLVSLMLGIVLIYNVIIAADMQMKYKEASKYLTDNEFIYDELEKEEVISVYNDIISDNLSLELTKEVLVNTAYEASLVGEMIPLPANATAREIYDILNKNEYIEQSKNVDYIYYNEEIFDIESEKDIFSRSVFERYDGDKLLWSVVFDEIILDKYGAYKEFGDYVVVYGDEAVTTESEGLTYVALIDNEGNVLWNVKLDSGKTRQKVGDIVMDEDSISVFGRAEMKYYWYAKLDMEGNVIDIFNESAAYTEVNDVCSYADGYIVLNRKNDGAVISFIDSTGHITGKRRFSDGNEKECNIESIIEFEGKLYVSGYVYTGNGDSSLFVDMFKGLHSDEKMLEYTVNYRDMYEAKLWYYDKLDDKLVEVYSVYGAQGDVITVDDDNHLIWNVKGISNYEYLGVSGVSFKEVYNQFSYEIDKENKIICKIKHN